MVCDIFEMVFTLPSSAQVECDEYYGTCWYAVCSSPLQDFDSLRLWSACRNFVSGYSVSIGKDLAINVTYFVNTVNAGC